MTAPRLSEVLAGLKSALSTIDGLRPLTGEPDQPNFPTAYPRLVDWTYDMSFGAGCDEIDSQYHFDIWVLVDLRQGMARAQAELVPYVSPVGTNSIKRAIERDQSLGGCVSYAIVTGGGSYGTADIAGLRALAASVRCEVQV